MHRGMVAKCPGGKIALVENHCSSAVLSELSRVMEMFYIRAV